jgi:hypothetical protein
VSWNRKSKKWRASLAKKYIGSFDNENAAARDYDNAAIEVGQLDWLNFNDYELR